MLKILIMHINKSHKYYLSGINLENAANIGRDY